MTQLVQCTNLCVMAERETVTKRKAADILGVHPSTVQRMIESGRLEATRIGGNDRTAMYVIYRSHVDRLARQRKAAA